MKEKGFHIPEGYFEQKKVELKEIAQQEDRSKIAEKQSTRPYYYLAAAAILIFGLFILFPSSDSTDLDLVNFSELKDSEVIHFLSEDPSGVYPESFIDLPEDHLEATDKLDTELIDAYLDETYLPIEYL